MRTNDILQGDALQMLKTLPSESVQCCLTSPPYFQLRHYLRDDHPDKPLEIGQEETLDAYVTHLVHIFQEVKRVLRPDGVLWLNLGDCFSGSGRGVGSKQAYLGEQMPRQWLILTLSEPACFVTEKIFLDATSQYGIPSSVSDQGSQHLHTRN